MKKINGIVIKNNKTQLTPYEMLYRIYKVFERGYVDKYEKEQLFRFGDGIEAKFTNSNQIIEITFSKTLSYKPNREYPPISKT